MLLAVNYSANFGLYCLGNKAVREEAFKFLFRCKHIYWADWHDGKTQRIK